MGRADLRELLGGGAPVPGGRPQRRARWRARQPRRVAAPPCQHEITALSAAEARRLIQAAEGDRMAVRWLAGLALGLRQGEALGLWWEDIDLTAQVLRVRRALQRQRGGGLVFTAPKTARSKRTIPLPK